MSDASLLLRLYVMHVLGEIAEMIKIKSPGRMMQSTFVLGFFYPNNRWKSKPKARPTSLHFTRTHADDDGHQRKMKKKASFIRYTRHQNTRISSHWRRDCCDRAHRKVESAFDVERDTPCVAVQVTHDAYLFFRLYSSSLDKGFLSFFFESRQTDPSSTTL